MSRIKQYSESSSKETSPDLYENNRFLVFFCLLFGFNYTPVERQSKYLRLLLNIYCVSVSTCLVYCLLRSTQSVRILDTGLLILDYGSNVIYLSFLASLGKALFRNHVDYPLGITAVFFNRIKICVNIIICLQLIVRFYLIISNILYFDDAATEFLPFVIEIISSNFANISLCIKLIPTILFTFFMLHRMRKLRVVIEKSYEEKIRNSSNLVEYQTIYSKLMDCVDDYRVGYSPLYVISVAIFIPRMILLFRVIILYVLAEEHSDTTLIEGVEMILNFIFLTFPAVVAELVTSEADALMMGLLDQRVISEGEYKDQIDEFLYYIETRPYKFEVWKMFTLGLTLPAELLVICSTYFIVVAQFSGVD